MFHYTSELSINNSGLVLIEAGCGRSVTVQSYNHEVYVDNVDGVCHDTSVDEWVEHCESF